MSGAVQAQHGHLVVRAPNWVGDLVMATPVLAAAPGCGLFERVTVLVRGHLAGVVRSSNERLTADTVTLDELAPAEGVS